jgi:hypothetical protein
MERCSWARSLIRVFKARLRLGPSLSGVNAKSTEGRHGGQRRRQGENHQVSKLHGREGGEWGCAPCSDHTTSSWLVSTSGPGRLATLIR